MTNRLTWALLVMRQPVASALMLVIVAGCGSAAAPSAPAWSFAAAPSATAVPTPTSAPSTVTPATPATPSPRASAAVTPTGGLAATCAAQWAASVSRHEDGSESEISAVLFSKSGGDAPAVEPTAATLVTDQGPVELAVWSVSSDENNTVPGSTRVSLGLPPLKAGSYRAEFLDLTDATGTWRFRVGDFSIRVLPGSAPEDLKRDGGSIEVGQGEGGSVQGFEIGLRNLTTKPIEVAGVSTDIPGLPVKWVLVERDPVRIVERVKVPAGAAVTLLVGTEETAQPVSFVLATAEIRYRVGGSPESTALFDPIEFQSGVIDPAPAAAYAAGLPSDACAQQP